MGRGRSPHHAGTEERRAWTGRTLRAHPRVWGRVPQRLLIAFARRVRMAAMMLA